MADTEQQNDSTNLGAMADEAAALDAAVAQAKDELDAMQSAVTGDELSDMAETENASIHEVPGIGRYAIPSHPGWEALLEVVKDKTADIDWSSSNYPVFDGIVAYITESGPLDDPLEDRYEDPLWVHLRENIAAVRNFIMVSYYADERIPITADNAKKSLEQIARYVGDGLHNNLRFLGLVPNHDPNKPFIDLHTAAEPDGIGAQYLYEKILEMQRQSSWMRPFAAIVEMFGGKPLVDWMLPSADSTPFRNHPFSELSVGGNDAIMNAQERLRLLEEQRAQLQDEMELTAQAVDLEAMGNQFLTLADQLQGVSQLSEPVRQDAIRIAKDILDKLKIKLGAMNVLDGLGVQSGDSVAGLGGLVGVGTVFERVLAWGRGIDPTIMNDPAVMAGIQTIGQLGYLAKTEALRLAKSVGNNVLADRLMARIANLPAAFKITEPTKFRDMLDRVERGIDTVLNRIKEVNGPNALVGHTPDKTVGSYMASTPTAGLAMQVSADGATNRDALGKRNMEVMIAEETALQAQAARIQSQAAARRTQDGQQTTTPARSARGQQAVQQARQQRQSSGTPVNPNQANLTAQQRAQLQRQAAFRASHAHDHDHDHDHHNPHHNPATINPNLINPALMKQIKAMQNTASGLTNAPVMTGRAAYNALTNANTQGLKPPATPNAKNAAKTEAEKKQLEEQQPPPVPPHKGGMGR